MSIVSQKAVKGHIFFKKLRDSKNHLRFRHSTIYPCNNNNGPQHNILIKHPQVRPSYISKLGRPLVFKDLAPNKETISVQ